MPLAEHHPCYSGLQVQGTANSPAARKLYDVLVNRFKRSVVQYTCFSGFCQVSVLMFKSSQSKINLLILYHEYFAKCFTVKCLLIQTNSFPLPTDSLLRSQSPSYRQTAGNPDLRFFDSSIPYSESQSALSFYPNLRW